MHIEQQFTICVRHEDKIGSKYYIREDFLRYVSVDGVTGNEFTNTLPFTLDNLTVGLYLYLSE